MDDHPYEGHATRTTVHLAQRRTETERPILSFSRFPAAGPNYSPALAEAMQFRCMSREEFRDLIQDDLITLGRNRNHAVVEISLRPSNEDIRRAMHGDSIFQKVTGEEARPVVTVPGSAPSSPKRASDHTLRTPIPRPQRPIFSPPLTHCGTHTGSGLFGTCEEPP